MFGEKSDDFTGVLTVVGCLDVQNAAFTNQSGEDTNQIGECGRMEITLDKQSCISA